MLSQWKPVGGSWLCCLAVLGAMPIGVAVANDVLLEHVDVFVHDEVIDGIAYDTYRIPNIARTNDGTLVAVAEARLSSAADPGGTHIDLVSKRSTDGGRTWSAGHVLDRNPGTVLSTAGVPTNRTSASNSVTFVDRSNGRLWNMNLRLPSGLGAAAAKPGVDDMQTWARFSDDDGITWSASTRIRLPQYEDFYPNLGSTTQLANGRLVVPATRISSGSQSRSFALFSDDQGTSWYAGDLIDAATNEAQIVELTDGRLLMTARQNGGGGRVFSYSLDQGASWQPSFTGFSSTTVMEAVERFEPIGPDGQARSLLVHTRPAGGSVTARTNLELLVASDETSPGGPRFGDNRLLFQGYTAYSDLVAIDSQELGVLWERGDTGHNQSIVYTRVNDTFLEPAAAPLGLIAHEGFAYDSGSTLAETRGPPPGVSYTDGFAPVNFSGRTDLDLVFSVAMGIAGGGTATIDPGLPRNDQANGIYGQIFKTGADAGAVTQITVQRAPNGTGASNLYLHLYADTDLSDGIDPASFLGSSQAAASLSPTDAGMTSWSFPPGAVVLAPDSPYLFAFASSATPGDTTVARASLIVSPTSDGYAIGGNGFNSAWHATATNLTAGPGATAAKIVAGSLEHAGLRLPADGNHVRLAAGGSLARGLGVGLDLDSDGSFYASVLVTRAADTGPDDATDESFLMQFLDAASQPRVGFGIDDDESFFIDGPGGRVSTAVDALNPSDTYFLLLKIESRAAGTGAFDQLFLKAFGADEPIPEVEDGLNWTLVGGSGGDEASLLDRLAIQAGRSAVWSFDELRVGGDYASVAGGGQMAAGGLRLDPQSVPEPTGLGLVALGVAAVAAVQRTVARRAGR